jgi:TolB-like protein/Tfp pilus assembly protein PilF
MGDQRSKLQLFVTEMTRRRMFRVVILYVIVSFAVLEGANNLASALNFPEWTLTLVAVLVLLGLPVSLILGWIFDITSAGVVRTQPLAATVGSTPAAASGGIPISGGKPGRKSIAVLPFVDMSPDRDQEYFGDGIAEEIINALTRIEDLRVVARTSSFALKGRDQHVRVIGPQLNVGTLLEGSVRRMGNQVRITAQLVDVTNGYHLWSERYDREMEDVFAIQDEIARAIVDTLKVKLVGDEDARIVRPGTADLEAYTLYLKGRYHWSKRTANELETGIELFQEAIAIDDRYALAWAGLADSYSILGWYRHISAQEAYERTELAAVKAVAVDDSLAEAYTSLAYAKFLYAWDWAGAESDFQRAIERNPSYPIARHWYAEFLMAMGRFDEAIEQVDHARALDPLSLTIGMGVGWAHYFLGRYDQAVEQYEKMAERDPNLVLTPWFLGPACVEAGMYDRAIAVYEDWVPRVQRKVGLTALLAHAYAVSGRREDALKAVAQLEERARRERVPPDYLALVYVGLGEIDRAFEWLDRALEQRVWYLAYLKVDPAFAPLRSDPRYGELLTKIGLDRTPRRGPSA